MNLRRFLGSFAKVTLAIGALSVSAFAGADDYHYNDHYNDHYNGCGPCPQPCQSSCCGMPIIEAPCLGWAYNPPAYARCANCDTNCCNNSFWDSLSARVDFLWWRANEEGIQLGTEEAFEVFSNDPTPLRTTVINKSHVKHPNFKYDPGFRLGLINACACDCYDIAFNWTHFHTKAKAHGETDPDNTTTSGVLFFSDWERLIGPNPFAARARYTLNLDLLDLELGRKFYVSNCFVLRPSIGLRGVRIDQNYRVESVSNLATATDPFFDFTSEVKSRSDFLAIGPRVGVDVEVHLGCGLAIFGQAAGSIVFGKFDNHSKELFRDFATNPSTTTAIVSEFEYEAKNSAHRTSRTITDLAIGIRWDHCFEWCNRYHPVGIAFAWEHHAFYDMNNFNFAERGYDVVTGPNGAVGRKHGDLFTQGLTVSATFGF